MERLIELINYTQNILLENWFNILVAIVIVIAFKMLSSVLAYIIIKIFNIKKNKEEIKKVSFYNPIKIFFVILGIYIATLSFELPIEVTSRIYKAFKIAIIVLVAKGFAGMVSPKSRTFNALQQRLDILQNKNGAKFICKLIRILIYIIAGFIIITELGYNLNGLVAGLGIGSAIIALAVQDVAKNLLGGVTILTDGVFSVGDYIKVGENQGTVEGITIRSTRIRTLDGMELTMPNGILANSNIINYNRMEQRRIEINLVFDSNISYDVLSRIKEEIRSVLNNYPHVIKNSLNINYTEINKDEIKLHIYLYTDMVDYSDYLEVKGKINEAILYLLSKEKRSLKVVKEINVKN